MPSKKAAVEGVAWVEGRVNTNADRHRVFVFSIPDSVTDSKWTRGADDYCVRMCELTGIVLPAYDIVGTHVIVDRH